jgi:hypothetical protein
MVTRLVLVLLPDRSLTMMARFVWFSDEISKVVVRRCG